MAVPIIRVVDVAKRYRTHEKTLAGAFKQAFGRSVANGGVNRLADGVFWALNGVSFEIGPGEIVGVLGRNGSGKTTLLRILSRITRPTRGFAEIHGRTGILLGVGAGFHPELTGRENVYMSGAIHGMKAREIAARFDEIVAFAEVEPFLDIAVRRYSSGMGVRLAFSVGAHLQADVLLIDEALAVGDASFRRKCVEKIHQLARDGRTVLFVSHDPTMMQSVAQKALLLEQGRILAYGPADEVIHSYLTSITGDVPTVYDLEHARRGQGQPSGPVRLVRLELEGGEQAVCDDRPLRFLATIRSHEAVSGLRLLLTIMRAHGGPVGTVSGPDLGAIGAGDVATYRIEIPQLPLAAGFYHCALTASGPGDRSMQVFDSVRDVLRFSVSNPRNGSSVDDWRLKLGPVRFPEQRVERIHG
jgi:lipopolysaccharide transport system ATP-binding protein